jgi:hypothetical protein
MGARSIAQRLKSWLASPRAIAGIVLVAVLVAMPSLGAGLAADDYWHKIVLTRDPEWASLTPRWYSLFTFYDGDPARTNVLLDIGMSCWWTDQSMRIAFFRPVSAATHALDYLLWPRTPWLMHAHSIAWYGALVAVAAWVYRRVLGGRGGTWIPAFAALLYGLDHNHGTPIAWIANRNALVAGVFALAALGAHDVAARSSRRAWSVGSAWLLALALASGESAVGIVGFFVAHVLFLDDRRWRPRLASLVPQIVVLVAWTLVYRLGDFGVRGSGVYVEPLRAPLSFLGAAATHLPLLLATEAGAPSVDLYTFLPLGGRIAILVICLAFLAWSVPAVMRLVRADRTARFFLVGSLLAILPSCAVFPSGRLMTVGGFGLLGLVALVGAGVLEGAAWLPLPSERFATRLVRSFAIWSVGGHLLLSPLVLQVTMRQLVILNDMLARTGTGIPVGPETAHQRLVIINAPDTMFVAYLALARRLAGEQLPPRLFTIAGGQRTIDLSRTDEQTVLVRVEGGFYRDGIELLTRSRQDPIPIGSHVRIGTIDIEILETTAEGVPLQAAFHFATSAEAGEYVWMRWESGVLAVTAPPRIGEHLTIAGQLPELF